MKTYILFVLFLVCITAVPKQFGKPLPKDCHAKTVIDKADTLQETNKLTKIMVNFGRFIKRGNEPY